MSLNHSRLSRFGRRWRALHADIKNDIFALTKACQFEPTWQQAEVLDIVQWESRQPLVRRKKRISVKSGQGPGKSTVSVYVALWRTLRWLDSMTVVTAPTMNQLKDVFLGEARRQLMNADPTLKRIIDIGAERIVVCKRPNWMIRCRTATTPENFQGYHQDRLTFIVDEASGVDARIIQQIQGTLTNPDSLLLLIGNPNTRVCKFFDTFTKARHLYHTYTFNAEESPIVSRQNIELIEKEYGRDSDVFRVRVLGEFPETDSDAIFNIDDLEACTKVDPLTVLRLDGAHNQKQFGIDLARYGSDESTIFQRQGAAILAMRTFTKTEPSRVLAEAMRMQRAAGWRDEECLYVVDADGMGQGAVHTLYSNDKSVLEFHTNGRSPSRDYANAATASWFGLQPIVRARKCSIPNDNRLLQQLSTRRYVVKEQSGKTVLCIEKKDDFKKRLSADLVEGVTSPDRADGLVMSFYDPRSHQGAIGIIRR